MGCVHRCVGLEPDDVMSFGIVESNRGAEIRLNQGRVHLGHQQGEEVFIVRPLGDGQVCDDSETDGQSFIPSQCCVCHVQVCDRQ